MTQPEFARPTRVRWLIVTVAMLAAVLLYVERVCLSVADVYVREDLGLNTGQMGWAFAAFFLAYAIGQVPGGWLAERYGPRLMMTLFMVAWSGFGVAIALAPDFWTLLVSRALLGLSQAGAYPTAAVLVRLWVPVRSRGFANGFVAFGGRFGGAFANALTGILIVAFVPLSTPATLRPADVRDPTGFVACLFNASPGHLAPVHDRVREALPALSLENHLDSNEIAEHANRLIQQENPFPGLDFSKLNLSWEAEAILQIPAAERTQLQRERLHRLVIEKSFPGVFQQLHGLGWRPTLLSYGLSGLALAIVMWFVIRNRPRNHPWVNDEEAALIEAGQTAEPKSRDGIPWKALARDGNLWLFSLNQVFVNVGWIFLITLFPRFLDERFAVPVDVRGIMTTIPLFAGCFGLLLGGWFTDRLGRSFGLRVGRALPIGVGRLPCVLGMLLIPFMQSAWTATAMLTLVSFAADFGMPAIWAFAQDTGERRSGTVLGWGNMWGNFGAGAALVAFASIQEQLGWDGVFYAGALAFALAVIIGTFLDARRTFQAGSVSNDSI